MPRTYLNKIVHLVFIALVGFCLLISLTKLGLYILIIYFLTLYLFRKSKEEYYKELEPSADVILSPIHGKILGIKKGINHKVFGENLWEIRFLLPLGEESGLYLPFEAEVSNLLFKRGESFFRYSKDEIPPQDKEVLDGPLLTLKNEKNLELGIQFLECPTGLYPRFFVRPGDLGKAKANFGYFPLGGTVLLYLPEIYEILVKENTTVSPGEKLIASVRN